MAGFWEIKKIADLGLAHLPVNSIMAIYVKTFQDTLDLRAKGWYLCDGKSGTPNLRDHFIMGGNPGDDVTGERVDGASATGNHAITISEMPFHGHSGEYARNERGTDATGGSEFDGWVYAYPKGHPEMMGTSEQPASMSTGGSEPHYHAVDIIPSHIQIGYFMYTGIPG